MRGLSFGFVAVLCLVAAGCGDDSSGGGAGDAGGGGDGDAAGAGDGGGMGGDGAVGDGAVADAGEPDAALPLATWAVAGASGYVQGLAVDDSGVYVAGDGGSVEDWRVEKRSHVDGSVLWVHGTDVGRGAANGIAVDDSGVYVLGDGWLHKRELDDGELLWSIDLPLTRGKAVVADEDGLFVVGAAAVPDATSPNQLQWRVDRRSPDDGSELWSVAVDHTVASDDSDGLELVVAAALDATSIYVAGSIEDGWRIERRDRATGELAWGVEQPLFTAHIGGVAVADGAVFVGASQSDDTGGRFQWRVERRSADDGGLDWGRSFDPSPGGYDDHCADVAADGDTLYLVGLSVQDAFVPGDRRWEIRAWDLATGGQERWRETPDFGPGNDVAEAVTVDGRAIYVAGRRSHVAGTNAGLWQIEKRDKRDGQIAAP